MNPAQLRRRQRHYAHWSPPSGALTNAIRQVFTHLWSHLRLSVNLPAVLHSDEHPLYQRFLLRNPVAGHLMRCGRLLHLRTPSTAARTVHNPLFPVNYVDRLLRHRIKEHTRETIAFGRNACLQMHRAWIFAYDHNCRRPHRCRRPQDGSHALQAGVPQRLLGLLTRQFFFRRFRLSGIKQVPEAIRSVWLAALPTPPVRCAQKGSSVRIPDYAKLDLACAYQHAS